MRVFAVGFALTLGCGQAAFGAETAIPGEYGAIVAKHAQANGVPEALIHRIIMRESRYNPRARNGPYYGMMQISMATARGAGYRGAPAGLLDADTNLTYAVRYLAGAYKVAGGNHDRAVGYYARGFYYAARSKGMLAAIGMGRDGKLTAPTVAPGQPVVAAASSPAATAPAPQMELASVAPAPRAIPLPTPRGPAPETAARTIDPKAAAPVLASVVPTPQPRDEGPAVTGSVAPRAVMPPQRPQPAQAQPAQIPAVQPAPTAVAAAPLPIARDVAKTAPTPQPRAISATVQPALASAAPVAPTRASAPVPAARPAPELAYAGAANPAIEAAPAQLRSAPLPPRR